MNGPTSPERDEAEAAVVDVDEPDSWPRTARVLVEAWDRQVPAREFISDLPMPDLAGHELAHAFDGHRLRTYHCTRLLDHEADDVQNRGLRPFTAELFETRLDRALEHGHLTGQQHRRLRAGHLAADGLPVTEARRARGRRDRVHMFVGMSVLDAQNAVELLLTQWGGEGIARSAAGVDEARLLQRLGRPSVVVCAVTLTAAAPPTCFPALPRCPARRASRPCCQR